MFQHWLLQNCNWQWKLLPAVDLAQISCLASAAQMSYHGTAPPSWHWLLPTNMYSPGLATPQQWQHGSLCWPAPCWDSWWSVPRHHSTAHHEVAVWPPCQALCPCLQQQEWGITDTPWATNCSTTQAGFFTLTTQKVVCFQLVSGHYLGDRHRCWMLLQTPPLAIFNSHVTRGGASGGLTHSNYEHEVSCFTHC